MERAPNEEGVLFIGRAQEKTGLFRTEKRRNADGRTYPWIVRSTGVVNHFYIYAHHEVRKLLMGQTSAGGHHTMIHNIPTRSTSHAGALTSYRRWWPACE